MEGLDTGVQPKLAQLLPQDQILNFINQQFLQKYAKTWKVIAGNLNDRMERLRAYQEYKICSLTER
jgi:hypothetical protein